MQIIKDGQGIRINTTAAELQELAHQMKLVESGAPVIVTTPGQTHTATVVAWDGSYVHFHTTNPVPK